MKLIHILAIIAIEAVLLCAGVSVASRNSSGTMSGINGPYTPGSVISSSVINARLADIETELTDSKSRSGKGDFSTPVRGADGTNTAPTYSFTSETTAGLYRVSSGTLAMTYNGTESCRWTSLGIRCANGAVATPSISFSNDTGSGLYRIGSNDIGFAINGVKVAEWLTTGLIITAPNTASLKALSGAAGTATDISVGRTAFEGRLGVAAAGNNYAAGSVAGDIILGTSGGNLWLDTNTGSGTPSLKVVAANGGVVVAGGLTANALTVTTTAAITGATTATGGLTIGSGGTATTQMNFGSCVTNAGTPSVCTATVAAGAKCVANPVGTSASTDSVTTSVSATTLTITIQNGVAKTINYICF